MGLLENNTRHQRQKDSSRDDHSTDVRHPMKSKPMQARHVRQNTKHSKCNGSPPCNSSNSTKMKNNMVTADNTS